MTLPKVSTFEGSLPLEGLDHGLALSSDCLLSGSGNSGCLLAGPNFAHSIGVTFGYLRCTRSAVWPVAFETVLGEASNKTSLPRWNHTLS